MAKDLFVDTNIFLDLILTRSRSDVAAKFLYYAVENRLFLYTSVSCIQTIIYILEKEKLSLSNIKKAIGWINEMVELVHTSNEMVEQAIRSDFNDFEDGILYHTALANKCDAFVTQNIKDFESANQIPAFTPAQLIDQSS